VAAPVLAMAEARQQGGNADTDAEAEWDALAREDDRAEADTPVVDSPSISGDWPADEEDSPRDTESDEPSAARDDALDAQFERPRRRSQFQKAFGLPGSARASGKSFVSLPTACAAMGALVLALIIWRVNVVHLLPQTAAFYKMVGLEVNLRGLAFKDVKVATEIVGGKPVLVIEGAITAETRKPVELPRLRFSVRDAQGTEIYAWNAMLEQPALKPGERALFKSRLASPPPEGRDIDVRFFSKRDLAGGGA
jgi:hypothetical protein